MERVTLYKVRQTLLGPTLALAALGLSSQAAGVTLYKAKQKPFLFDITTFTTTLSLPVTDQLETFKMSDSVMEQRLDKSPKDETVEPLSVLMSSPDQGAAQIIDKVALAGQEEALAQYLKETFEKSKPVKPGAATRTVEINRDAFGMIDRDAFADMFSRTHHKLTLATQELKNDRQLRAEFFKQITPFFPKSERTKLQAKINKGEPIEVDTELLPEFARKMVKKYIIYRGPNCFHAALAFQSPQLTSSSLINVKKETGYHRAMINYDELWRVLNSNFYEVDPDDQALKYGDVLVFFDVPKDAEDDIEKPIDFKWIRHTATYLFGGYTYSKGSKSPNTPYTVRTLAEEWKTWKKYTSNLGVKVFRRSQKTVKHTPPRDLTDWIY
jgi:hypothetical protein